MTRLLIVDDNPQNLYLLQVLLSTNGFELESALNGSEALERARRAPPDIIISDILMPGMDGFALCRACKQDERLRDIPFIFYTATYTDPKDEEFALSLGAARFIVKPLEPDKFLAILRETLETLEASKGAAPRAPLTAQAEYYEQYSATLIRKLEDKVLQLEETSHALELDIVERKRADEALRESEERYRSLFENATIGVFHSLPAGRFVRVNPALAHMLGYASPEEMVATITDINTQIYVETEKREALLQAAVSGDGWIRAENSYRRKDGSIMTGTLAVRKILSPEGSIAYLEGWVEDITERKQAEQALRDSEERYRRLFETMLDSFALHEIICDDNGKPNDYRFLEVNAAFEKMTGLKAADIIGKTVRQVIPSIEEFWIDTYGEVVLTGQSKRFENYSRSLDKYFEVAAFRPREKQFTAIFVDITERKRAEQALHDSEERFRALVENASDLIAVLNVDGTVRYVSPAIERLLGYTVGEASGKSIYEFIHPEDVDKAMQSMAHRLANPDVPPGILQIRARHADGTWRTLEGRGNDLLTRREVGGIVLNFHDITERRRAEQDLERRAEQFSHLYDAGLALNSVLEARAQLETIFDVALKALRAGCANFFRYDTARDELRLEMIWPRTNEATRQTYDALGSKLAEPETLAGWVGQQRRTQYLPNVFTDPHWITVDPAIHSALGVPIIHEKQLLGVLCVFGWQTDAFSIDDQRWLELFASQVAVALENTRLYEETRLRLNELEAVNRISTALRTAQTLDEMLPVLLDVTLQVLQTNAGSVWLYDPIKNEYQAAVTRGWGPRENEPSLRVDKPGESLVGYVVETGQPYSTREFRNDPHMSEAGHRLMPPGVGGAAIPIHAGERVIGAFIVNVQAPRELTRAEVHLLTTLSEIAGNAIQRTQLHQQTERRLQNLTALSDIDRTISSSFDLRISLAMILKQVTEQLRVDAAAVLLFNPGSQMLEYAAGRGFRTSAIHGTRLRMGESHAGRAAMERRVIQVANLKEPGNLLITPLLSGEEFVSYFGVPLIAKGQIKGVLEVFHRARLEPDDEWLDFMNILAEQTGIAIDNVTLFDNLQRSNTELALAYDATIEGWSHALDLRDKETEGHTQRVTDITVQLARAFGIGEAELVQVRWGALLHDIGKMGVPDGILLKPGPLTDEEWVIMKKHPVFAYEMLAPIRYLNAALDIPYCHHEKWDGTGYPRGMKGEEIPLTGRIFAVVDVWDALCSDRPYRAAWSEDKAREEIRSLAGKQFDPRVVESFLKLIEKT